MSFGTGPLQDIQLEGSGELHHNQNIVFSHSSFDDGVTAGLVARFDATTKTLKKIDGSTAPIIAGVVVRTVTGLISQKGAYDNENQSSVNVTRKGLQTVDAVSGETAPAMYTALKVSNEGNAEDGKVSATTGVSYNAEFIDEVQAGVWLIHIK